MDLDQASPSSYTIYNPDEIQQWDILADALNGGIGDWQLAIGGIGEDFEFSS
jgi:hypothetical protein